MTHIISPLCQFFGLYLFISMISDNWRLLAKIFEIPNEWLPGELLYWVILKPTAFVWGSYKLLQNSSYRRDDLPFLANLCYFTTNVLIVIGTISFSIFCLKLFIINPAYWDQPGNVNLFMNNFVFQLFKLALECKMLMQTGKALKRQYY